MNVAVAAVVMVLALLGGVFAAQQGLAGAVERHQRSSCLDKGGSWVFVGPVDDLDGRCIRPIR